MRAVNLISTFAVSASAIGFYSANVPTIKELASQITLQSSLSEVSNAQFPAYTLQVPIDHFHNDSRYEPHSNATFGLRYWFDASHYKGGPVFVLSGGETSGADRLPFLEKGLIQQLAQLTNGIAVVLEHRYYGHSYPTDDFSTESLRFLTTQQAMADTAYFASNVAFKGFEGLDLTAAKLPYILYGGSYAGAFVAFLRVLYPDVFWGAIASSAVTEAIYDYWQYFEPIIEYGQKDCIEATQKLMHIVDTIVLDRNDTQLTQKLKSTWQTGSLTHIEDFANILTISGSLWQGRNWDPETGSPMWDQYCASLTNKSLSYPSTESVRSDVRDLIVEGGYTKELESLTIPLLNHIGWLNTTFISRCQSDLDSCLGSFDSDFYKQDDLSQTWRLWPYQYCTQWGYLATGSGYPKDRLPLVPRILDLEFSSMICREAFNITEEPDVASINVYGGFDISYDRLAFIDGEQDPWRPATPHAKTAKDRKSTTSQPFVLIEGGVHHWDENGLFPNEITSDLPPKPVRDAQDEEKRFVVEWVKEWKAEQLMKNGENVEL